MTEFYKIVVNNADTNQTFVTVVDMSGEVMVTDLDVSCISNISISKELLFSSSRIQISNFNFRLQNFNLPHRYHLSVDIVFSDGSRTDIFSFSQEQYSLKFITNTNIIEISDVDSMWYDYQGFNGAESIYVELQESKFCSNPRTIFRKLVTLNIPETRSPIRVTTESSTVVRTSNTTTLTMKTIVESQLNTKFIWFVISGAILMIVIICGVLAYCKKKKFFAHNSYLIMATRTTLKK